MIKLCHKKVYWKQEWDKALKYLITDDYIAISDHCKFSKNKWCDHDKIDRDKLIKIVKECRAKKRKSYLFEIEIDHKKRRDEILKAVFRTSYNKDKDIVIVVRENYIVTTWLQNKEDKHFTLDTKKYWKPLDK